MSYALTSVYQVRPEPHGSSRARSYSNEGSNSDRTDFAEQDALHMGESTGLLNHGRRFDSEARVTSDPSPCAPRGARGESKARVTPTKCERRAMTPF